ncbi:phage regulatory CII family protein [Halodesulfovibrio aestuarii]|uniref:phage regulatory CII family protein n=1 Tax=Halodesulfovibrio aestuarii TaxID=126333 RepID=UPI0004009B9C
MNSTYPDGSMISDNNYALHNLSPEDAFKLALERSGMTWQKLSKEMGWAESHTKRVFSLERYFPTYEDLPKFCSTVGNMVIINWLQVQAMQYGMEHKHADLDCQSLVFRISNLFGETSDVGQEAHKAVADGVLEPRELRRIIGELNDVVNTSLDMIADLRELERKLKAEQ